jgi:hypothetical protein
MTIVVRRKLENRRLAVGERTPSTAYNSSARKMAAVPIASLENLRGGSTGTSHTRS